MSKSKEEILRNQSKQIKNKYREDGLKGCILEVFGPEASGKTTMALHMLSKVQKDGGMGAYIDAENAFDPTYAEKLGVDMSKLLLNQPDSGEQALDIVEKLCQSGQVSIIVIDSVSGLVPMSVGAKEIDGTMNIATTARLLSQTLPRIAQAAGKSGTVVVFINQIRMNIGVMYEQQKPFGFKWLNYDTLIHSPEGRSEEIGRLYNARKPQLLVYGYDEENNTFPVIEVRNIVRKTKTDIERCKQVHIETTSIESKGGRFGVTLESNTEIYSANGWIKAIDVLPGDLLATKWQSKINSNLKQFLYGMFCGDSHLASSNSSSACLKLQDSTNPAYLKWKMDKLSKFYTFSRNGKAFESNYEYELLKKKGLFSRRSPLPMLWNYNHLSMALWIMDDGHLDLGGYHSRYIISVKRFKSDKNILDNIKLVLNELNFNCTVSYKDGSIAFDTQSSNRIALEICTYIPEPMQYKLPPEFRGRYKDFELSSTNKLCMGYVKVIMARASSHKQERSPCLYDIKTSQGNFMAGGVTNGLIIRNSKN